MSNTACWMQLGERGQPLATGGVQSDHYLIEAFKHVYALRTELGDPDFVNNTALDSAIASAEFAASLAAMVKVSSTVHGCGRELACSIDGCFFCASCIHIWSKAALTFCRIFTCLAQGPLSMPVRFLT